MNEVKIFENRQFGQLRTIEKDGMTWFVGKDVAEKLGYQNGSRDINRHVDEEDRTKMMISDGTQMKETIVINESGLYSLVMSSKLPNAKAFKHWVTSEVLPSIYKTGSYQTPKVKLEKTPRYQTRLIATSVRDIGATANEMVKIFGCKKSMALTIAVPMIGKIYGYDSSPFLALIPPEDNPATLTASDVAREIGFLYKTGKPDAAKVNKLLAHADLQEKKGKEWRLTEEGKAYGEAKPYTSNGHSGYQILWTPDVVDFLQQFQPKDESPDKVVFLEEARKRGWQEDA